MLYPKFGSIVTGGAREEDSKKVINAIFPKVDEVGILSHVRWRDLHDFRNKINIPTRA